MQFPNQQGGQRGAGEAAEPTHHDHHESFRDNREIHVEIDALSRQLQGAAEPGEQAAEKED